MEFVIFFLQLLHHAAFDVQQIFAHLDDTYILPASLSKGYK
jgi:hypothetical protein